MIRVGVRRQQSVDLGNLRFLEFFGNGPLVWRDLAQQRFHKTRPS